MNYSIFLDDKIIGTSKLEFADPPMGVVHGKIIPMDRPLTFDFLLEYCNENNIGVTKYPEDKLISTMAIATLKILNEKGVEIKGVGSSIDGMDSDGFSITILGIDSPPYDEEFPHHVKNYQARFQ